MPVTVLVGLVGLVIVPVPDPPACVHIPVPGDGVFAYNVMLSPHIVLSEPATATSGADSTVMLVLLNGSGLHTPLLIVQVISIVPGPVIVSVAFGLFTSVIVPGPLTLQVPVSPEPGLFAFSDRLVWVSHNDGYVPASGESPILIR